MLIKKVTILDTNSKWHGKKVDVKIERGKVTKIARNIPSKNSKVLQYKDAYLSPSWVDIGTTLSDPGHEYRERIDQTAAAARAGGFSTIACFPSTKPAITNRTSFEYIQSKGIEHKVDIFPIPSASHNFSGKDISEYLDMHDGGATAFSDGHNGIHDSGLLVRMQQYALQVDATIINTVDDPSISNGGQMHEGSVSTSLGLKGIPSLSEQLSTQQSLAVQAYTEGKLCLYGISSQQSVTLIKKAKKTSNHIFCCVPYLNLIFTDEDMASFDTNLKVLPPLRTNEDLKSLIKGLNNGTIDCVTTNHTPLDPEANDLEFAYAEFGATGLETLFAALNTYASKIDLTALINALTNGPRAVLNMETPTIAEGAKANYTLFDTHTEWTYNATASNCINNPFWGKVLKGKVHRVIN